MRVQADSGSDPALLDNLNKPVHMIGGFDMKREDICAELNKVGNISFRLPDHEMHIERLERVLANSFNNRCSDRKIRNKAAIHYVHMKPVGLTQVYHVDIPLQIAEIGCEK